MTKMSRIGVKILPRDVILDTQGRAVEQSLALGGHSVSKARVGRYVELEIEGDSEAALKSAEQITKYVLYNPLIEKFELQVIE